jgi:peptide/nickel transport system substrate-binding protein
MTDINEKMADVNELKGLYKQRLITRREFVRRMALLGMATGAGPAFLASCAQKATPTETPAEAPTVAATSTPVPTVAATDTPAPTPTEAGPKILKMRMLGDIRGVDPAFMVGLTDSLISDCVFSGLVVQKPSSYDWVEDLVEFIEQSEDGMEITFKLREGVQFHKGYGELTTEDVKFSFERIADPEMASAYATDWLTLDHVEIIDKYNAKIVLNSPFAPLWTSTLPVNSGRIVCKKYVEEVGQEEFTLNPIGSGPYIFYEWTPEQKIILIRNEEYYGEQPFFDEIHIFPISENLAAEVALEAGEVDFAQISLASAERFENNPDFKVIKRPGLFYNWIGMNVENPKLADINVRQAILYGIDVNQILAAAYFGQAEREYGLLAPGLLGYWADAPKYERDVEKAREYLAKAGLESLDVTYTCSNANEGKIWGEIMQQNLAEVGINITIDAMDPAAYWQAGFGDTGLALELFGMGFSMYADPSWATAWFTCEQVGVWNWMRWCNKDFDRMHLEAVNELDPDKRAEIYIEMQKLWDENVISVWVTHGANIHAFKPSIEPALTPHGQEQVWYFRGT